MAQVLVHYAELGLKGKNRRRFEEALRRQLRGALGADKVLREHGRLVVELSDWSQDKAELLARLPGVRWFARTEPAPLDIDAMGEVAIALIREEWGEDVAGKRFRVLARRSDKRAPIKTIEIHEKLGGLLRRRLNLVVNLDEPEIVVGVEIARPDRADIFVRRWEGIGGLPVGTSGRGVVLFSGGLDSPVAAYWMLKRGMALELVHFYNSAIARDFGKIERLSALLSRYGGMIRLHLVDLEAFQRHAIAHVPADWRMVIYKRQMLRVAERIARNANAKALITGDSLGQVASQTLDNIAAIYAAVRLPVLSPLIGVDKEEIVRWAERIGTYPISIEPGCDICAFMLAKHPVTRADAEKAEALERLLPVDEDPPREERLYRWGRLVEAERISG